MTDTPQKPKLRTVLQEGVGLVQMILFKELRALIQEKNPDRDIVFLSMLAGAITNELFGTQNPEEKFEAFREEHLTVIEQELHDLAQALPGLRDHITDALRIQTLCDSQAGYNSSANLNRADALGILVKDREIPLPSTFMTSMRALGAQYGLIIPPVLITPEDDQGLVH
jgi:hypothetical protein